jgi:hypothetical protein
MSSQNFRRGRNSWERLRFGIGFEPATPCRVVPRPGERRKNFSHDDDGTYGEAI